jgi:glycogen debranching enzyme
MALPVLVSFTPENARETLATLEHLRSAGKVPNDVHVLIRKLRKALSDSGNGYA